MTTYYPNSDRSPKAVPYSYSYQEPTPEYEGEYGMLNKLVSTKNPRRATPSPVSSVPRLIPDQNIPIGPIVGRSGDELPWNDTGNEITTLFNVEITTTDEHMSKLPGESMKAELVKYEGVRALIDAASHKMGSVGKVRPNAHRGVIITKIKVLSHSNGLNHSVGIKISGMSSNLNFHHVDSKSGNAYLHIIPPKLKKEKNYTGLVYEANKDAFTPLSSKYGGVDLEYLMENSSTIGNSDYIYVPGNHQIVTTAIENKKHIDSNGPLTSEGKTMIDPQIAFDENGNPVGEGSMVRISKEYYDGFIKAVQNKVLQITKPVDLDKIEVEFHKAVGGRLGNANTNQNKDKTYRLSVNLEISYLTRFDV